MPTCDVDVVPIFAANPSTPRTQGTECPLTRRGFSYPPSKPISIHWGSSKLSNQSKKRSSLGGSTYKKSLDGQKDGLLGVLYRIDATTVWNLGISGREEKKIITCPNRLQTNCLYFPALAETPVPKLDHRTDYYIDKYAKNNNHWLIIVKINKNERINQFII